MKNICILIITLVSIILCGCSSKYNEETAFLTSTFSDNTISNYDYCVIIPGAGCNGCIQESEYFLKQNISNPNLLFILTNPSSIKILTHKTGIDVLEKDNILIDKEGRFKVPTKNAIYPCVVYFKEGKIENIDFQTPQTSALHDLFNIMRK